MFGRKQTITLLILLTGLLSLTLLATNLIASGWVPSADGSVTVPPIPELGSRFKFPLIPITITPERWRDTVITFLIVMALFSLVMLWRYPRLRLVFAFYLAIILFLYFFVLPNVTPPIPEEIVSEPVIEVVQPPLPESGRNLPVAEVGDPPSWFRTLIALVPALIAVTTAIFLVRRYLADAATLPLATEIAQNAEVALVEIEQGYDLRGAIIGAYVQMTETVRQNRGIVRKRAVTASEFAEVLQNAGLPLSPVERLTRLFEKVRYSSDPPGVRDQREAVSCLGEIVTAAERIREGA
jgi:hypothetical protein